MKKAFTASLIITTFFTLGFVGKKFNGIKLTSSPITLLKAKSFSENRKKIISILTNKLDKPSAVYTNNEYLHNKKSYSDELKNVYQKSLSFGYEWNKGENIIEWLLNIDQFIKSTDQNKHQNSNSEDPNSVKYTAHSVRFPGLIYRLRL